MRKLIAIISFLLFSEVLFAKTITVTSSEDSGAGTLREAIEELTDNGDIIDFDNNITTIQLADVIVIEKSITINGNASSTTIKGGGTGTGVQRFFDIPTAGLVVEFNNIILSNNWITCDANITSHGKLTFNNCTFKDNRANYSGGVVDSYSGILIVNNCIFINNRAGTIGGAIYSNSETYITDCTFKGNSGQNGGAIDIGSNAVASIVNCTFEENSSQFGGAIRNNGRASIKNCVFNKNGYECGSAIYNNESGNITVSNSVFSENKDIDKGTFRNTGNAIIINCLFTKNYSTASDFNTADRHSVIYNKSSKETVTLTLINSTIADNIGVGLYNSIGSVTMQNNIFWNNRGIFTYLNILLEYDVYVADGNITTANNLIGISNIDLNGNNNLIGINNDPLFVNTGNNYYSLHEDSPAIDAGNKNFYPYNDYPRDLFNKYRIDNDIIDMGAYEYQSGNPLTSIFKINKDEVTVYANARTIYIENTTEPVYIYNMMGVCVAHRREAARHVSITVSQAGVYVVKAGNTTKKVIVN